MSEIITCPAPLRANSPAVLVQDVYVSAPGYSEAVALLRKGERVTVIEVTDTFARVALRSSMVAPATGSASWLTYVVEVSALEMDLTDATGRAHAAWWFETAARWSSLDDIGIHLWIQNLTDEKWRRRVLRRLDKCLNEIIPLDPEQVRLPDGSRVVDALALKAVVEHLIAQRGEK